MKIPVLAFLLGVAASHAASFPSPYNSEPDSAGATTPESALAQLRLPEGFKGSLFAHDPMVRNPIAVTWDRRGRMWVAENFTYAERPLRADLALRDRVLILEDRDGDGRADAPRVFTDEVRMLTGLEVGHGGVWLMCPPELRFVPDADGDDVPDGPPQVVLDGFHVPRDNYHNFANGLRWGPDGWLYGRSGTSAPGEVGPPGSSAAARVPLRGGIWRFHPQRRVFEALVSGATNPWGHDWDAEGELFFTNTVNGHLWHAFPGAHFVAPFTRDPAPHAYAQIDFHADHWHFDTGRGWMASREGADDHGGGHAHCGAMIYQGDTWPEAYRGRLIMLNFHGRRTNVDRLEPQGSGFRASHQPEMWRWGDPWFRGIDIRSGPDDAAYVVDWSDTGECHDFTGVHRTSGRIYRIAFGTDVPEATPRAPAEPLAALGGANIWRARAAQLQLAERAARGELLAAESTELRRRLARERNPVLRLRALWALHGAGAADPALLRGLLHDPEPSVRAWAIRLIVDAWPLDRPDGRRPARPEAEIAPALLQELAAVAGRESSARVRLTLASALQRLPTGMRPVLAGPLLAHAEDAADHNLPLLLWYGLMPLGDTDPLALARLAATSEIPTVRRYAARRLAALPEVAAGLDLVLASAEASAARQRDVLGGLSEALSGLRRAPKPHAWDSLAAAVARAGDADSLALSREIATVFGDGRALGELRLLALDAQAELPRREAALRALIEARPDDLRAVCERLVLTRHLGSTALRGLRLFDDPELGRRLAKDYRNFFWDRPTLIDTLTARPAWARALLDEIAAGAIPRTELTAYHARNIRGHGDASLSARLAEVWGELRDSAADKQRESAELKARLTPGNLALADLSAGRAAFVRLCSACHMLYGEGGRLGPDLTGSGRDNLDYLLDNIVDPGAVVPADFRLTVLTLNDGRSVAGTIAARTDRTTSVRSANETVVIANEEILSATESAQSMMPEGLLQSLAPDRQRDLIAYLMSRQQVPLPEN